MSNSISFNSIQRNSLFKLASVFTAALATVILAFVFSVTAYAAIDVYEFDSVQQEAQYRGLIEELRCPKCQNQNLAGSDAPIAQDLKQKTYDLVRDNRSDGEIRDYMQERYGDFISYKPPVRPSTWILWFFPPLLLVVLIGGWFWQSRRRQLTARGQSGPSVEHTTTPLTASEKAELDRLLSRNLDSSATDSNITDFNSSSTDTIQDITSTEDR
ncbi:cytochrome c-type biogenesis protein CcmH [Psychrobacter sp. M13]|nr:cytochrome c-type biogenesis protein [Psychrobacter sp. M13]WLP95245.1 cytochrome c-type biogenesis protein CcmH [Psychrobacter sp. M13]